MNPKRAALVGHRVPGDRGHLLVRCPTCSAAPSTGPGVTMLLALGVAMSLMVCVLVAGIAAELTPPR